MLERHNQYAPEFETLGDEPRDVSEEKNEARETRQSIEELENQLFLEIIRNRLVNTFVTEMRSAGVSDQTISEFNGALHRVGNVDIQDNLLALPLELRQKRFKRYVKENLSGQEILEDLENRLTGTAQQIIGFHTSTKKINPVPGRDNPEFMTWGVKGVETSDLASHPLAFAARSYHGLYRDRLGPKPLLYVVADSKKNPIKPASDRSDSYGRKKIPSAHSYASGYSIVAKFDLAEIDKELRHEIEQRERPQAA